MNTPNCQNQRDRVVLASKSVCVVTFTAVKAATALPLKRPSPPIASPESLSSPSLAYAHCYFLNLPFSIHLINATASSSVLQAEMKFKDKWIACVSLGEQTFRTNTSERLSSSSHHCFSILLRLFFCCFLFVVCVLILFYCCWCSTDKPVWNSVSTLNRYCFKLRVFAERCFKLRFFYMTFFFFYRKRNFF